VDQRLLEAARDVGASRRRTFLLVTLPLSRQAILAGLVVTALPCSATTSRCVEETREGGVTCPSPPLRGSSLMVSKLAIEGL